MSNPRDPKDDQAIKEVLKTLDTHEFSDSLTDSLGKQSFTQQQDELAIRGLIADIRLLAFVSRNDFVTTCESVRATVLEAAKQAGKKEGAYNPVMESVQKLRAEGKRVARQEATKQNVKRKANKKRFKGKKKRLEEH